MRFICKNTANSNHNFISSQKRQKIRENKRNRVDSPQWIVNQATWKWENWNWNGIRFVVKFLKTPSAYNCHKIVSISFVFSLWMNCWFNSIEVWRNITANNTNINSNHMWTTTYLIVKRFQRDIFELCIMVCTLHFFHCSETKNRQNLWKKTRRLFSDNVWKSWHWPIDWF